MMNDKIIDAFNKLLEAIPPFAWESIKGGGGCTKYVFKSDGKIGYSIEKYITPLKIIATSNDSITLKCHIRFEFVRWFRRRGQNRAPIPITLRIDDNTIEIINHDYILTRLFLKSIFYFRMSAELGKDVC